MADWLDQLVRYGFAVVSGVPVADGEVARFAELFSHVRVTNYGRFFDVRTVVDPTNLAYSSLGLAPHTDNPYRDPVPTVQLLHCLEASTTGGDNSLVDGFRAAAVLRAADTEAFAALCATSVEFRYSDAEAELVARLPVFELDDRHEVRSVRFNPRSIQPPPLGTPMLDAWYRGYTALAAIVQDPAMQVCFRLSPGHLFVVDNRRVLHGRTAFDPSAGSRHLQGCYADIDGVRSTLGVLLRSSADPVSRILELFRRRGDEAYLGEPVSMSQHMIQTALEAQAAGASEAAIAAALLHDIGHLIHDVGDDAAPRGIDARHEDLGATWLSPFFGPEVTEPVRLHVAAKRYLCTVEPAYFATLSPASVETYHLQGGPMSPDEVAEFESSPGWSDAVAVRRWDDMGKDPARPTTPIETFAPLLRRLLRSSLG